MRAMSSPFLPIRFEAAYNLAKRNHKAAVGQIESLMFRLPLNFKPLFPQLFAMIPSRQASSVLKQLLFDSQPLVRTETLLNIARFRREDLLPLARKRLFHGSLAEKEASLYVLSAHKDTSCP